MESNGNNNTSMGELFQQRRLNASTATRFGNQQTHGKVNQQQQPPRENKMSEGATGSSAASVGKPSLTDIQAEQSRERLSTGFSNYNRSKNNSVSSSYYNQNNHSFNHHQQRGGAGGGGHHRRGSGGGSAGRRPRQQHDRSHLPLEQGAICSLKESFGFIRCAERMEEVFFHFSEAKGMFPVDMRLGDEVEFRVGPSSARGGGGDGDKLAAYQLRALEPGTVIWETEEEPGRLFRGLVERPVRSERGNMTDGTIRVTNNEEGEKEGKKDTKKGGDSRETETVEGPLIRFALADYDPSKSIPNDSNNSSKVAARRAPNRLSRGDLVEFALITDRRSKEKFAKKITLVLSERERARQEEERRMLEAATLERGVVTAIKGEYGFLKSNKRREEVYFHCSNLEIDDSDGKVAFSEGQDVEFLVVEEGADTDSRRRMSARRVKMQPRGSVRFYDVLASGMTGTVLVCPQPMDNTGQSLDLHGKIHLSSPLSDTDDDGSERFVEEVYLRSNDSPGGSFAFRGGSSMGLWIQEGDTLLFDVVKDFVDGACRAVPTKCLSPRDKPTDLTGLQPDSGDSEADGASREIRLMSLSLTGRAEGIINTVKDSFGFIHFAERPVDAHFKLFQLLPDQIQNDLRRNMGLSNCNDRGEALQLTMGAEVQFDLSVHGTINSSTNVGRHRGGRSGQQHERENLKAQRVLLLPPGTIRQEFRLASGVKGTISKDDPKQPYSGNVDLETAVKPASPEDRHPLVARLIDSYLSCTRRKPLVFHDVQSSKEDEVVISMLELKAKGKLTWKYLPAAEEPNYAGRLCVEKVDESEDTLAPPELATTPPPGETAEEKEACPEEKDDIPGEKMEKQPHSPKKKKAAKAKSVKTIRYDKGSMAQELKEDMPPTVGDIVELDLVQSRRTGQSSVTNMRMLERQEREVSVTDACAVGVVKEIVAARKFGFISVLDETAASREMLFFSLNEVNGDAGESSASPRRPPMLRKGDEVKFTIGTEKHGKRVALNVSVLPKGTIPSKADKNACRGLLLMSPSHTSLKNTPNRHASSSGPAPTDKTSRWDTGEDDRKKAGADEPITELGCILLLEDPSGMFKLSLDKERDESGDTASATSGPGSAAEEKPGDVRIAKPHLRYKNGALAIHGAGSSSAADESSLPRRGDLVSFVKAKSGSGVRDIRIVTRDAAVKVRGRLEQIHRTEGGGVPNIAKFIVDENQKAYDVSLEEVVSCSLHVLKEKEAVEGILHEGRVHGICRVVDLYLESKLGASHKERPKLNLTVKKDRGGTIMAQSMMAKGPDGSNGFAAGWTARKSKLDRKDEKIRTSKKTSG